MPDQTMSGLLSDRYQFEERGLIAVKGKGGIKTYLLKGPAAA